MVPRENRRPTLSLFDHFSHFTSVFRRRDRLSLAPKEAKKENEKQKKEGTAHVRVFPERKEGEREGGRRVLIAVRRQFAGFEPTEPSVRPSCE